MDPGLPIGAPAAMISGLDDLVALALARSGLHARGWTQIQRRRGTVDSRVVYRLELEDGRVVKARYCPDEVRAREVWRIGRHLALDGLARVYAQHGPILIEEWVDGTPLPSSDGTPEHVVQAAAVLSRLHAIEHIGETAVRTTMAAAEWIERARRDLALLTDRQALPRGPMRALQGALRQLDPGMAVAGLTHNDFCAENMVRTDGGRIAVVDNERLSVGPLAYDLGRVWCRWPMPAPAWALFLETYAAERDQVLTDSSLLIWKIAATAHSGVLRIASDPERLGEPLARLRELSGSLERAG